MTALEDICIVNPICYVKNDAAFGFPSINFSQS